MTTNDDIEGWGLKTIYSMVTIAKTRALVKLFSHTVFLSNPQADCYDNGEIKAQKY